MTAPTPDYLRTLAVAPNRLGDGWRVSAVAALHQSADALAAVTAERDQARQMLGDAQKEMVWLREQAATGVMRGKKAEQMLADAPHDHYSECGPTNYMRDHGVPEDELPECVCWKAGL